MSFRVHGVVDMVTLQTPQISQIVNVFNKTFNLLHQSCLFWICFVSPIQVLVVQCVQFFVLVSLFTLCLTKNVFPPQLFH